MSESVSGGLDLVPEEYREFTGLGTAEDFVCQNPQAGNMIYVVWSDTQPLAGFEGAERIPPYAFYGRENAVDVVVRQGKPWFRADKAVKMPFRK